MKKALLIILPFLLGFMLLGMLISGIGGGGGSYPVPPPATEEEAYIYQYTAYRLGINWEIPLAVHMTKADREKKSDLSDYNCLFDSLNCCRLKEEIWSEHEDTDEDGNSSSYWTLDETNYYTGAEQMLSYLGLSREEKSIDVFMNTLDTKNSRKCKLELETEYDTTVILITYYDFSEEETNNILLLLEEQYFSKLYGNLFGGGDLYSEDLGEIGNIAPNGMAIPLYYQYSGGWQNRAFGGGNIASSGCSVTSMAMVFSYLLDERITPNDIVDWTGNRYYVAPAGQSWSIFPACAGQWGVGCQNLGKDANAVVNALSRGRPVIASMAPGTFTRAGHFIVLRGVTAEGKILVNDPNDNSSKNFVNKSFDLNLIMRESKNFWSFSD